MRCCSLLFVLTLSTHVAWAGCPPFIEQIVYPIPFGMGAVTLDVHHHHHP